MARIEVILHGIPGGSEHDTDNYPVILSYSEEKAYYDASWIVPSYPGYIPAGMLSEIRVLTGPLSVVVDGPEGFQSGPYETNWVRSSYPRGKDCSFLKMDSSTLSLGGVSVSVMEGSLVIDAVSLGGNKSQAPAASPAEPAQEQSSE